MDISEFSRLDNQEHYLRHPWETARKDALAGILKDSQIAFPIQRIVDIGSGDAYVIHTLVDPGFAREYFAIDTAYTNEVVTQIKMNNSSSPVHYLPDLGTYFREHPTSASTLFLCMDVLEHLESESVILDHLQTPGNYYFFAVPAFQSVFSDHDVLLGHYRRYTLPQLTTLLQSNGFAILDRGYYFTSLLVARFFDRIINKNKKASIDNWKGGKLKTSLINLALKTDFLLGRLIKKAGINVHGLSCYCLCQK